MQWEIHQDLPYGTMADNEMRKMNIGVLQDDGVIFLWVTGQITTSPLLLPPSSSQCLHSFNRPALVSLLPLAGAHSAVIPDKTKLHLMALPLNSL